MSFTTAILKTVEYLTPFTTLSSLSAKLTDVPLGRFTQFLIKTSSNLLISIPMKLLTKI